MRLVALRIYILGGNFKTFFEKKKYEKVRDSKTIFRIF